LAEIRAARERLAGCIVRTPLVRLNVDPAPGAEAGSGIYLKLESLQPIGSFKLRGAANRILQATPAELVQGVWTASAGNMAQGAAWCARQLGLRCRVVVPDTAPAAKLDAIRRLGGEVVQTTFARWLEVFETGHYPGMEGLFIHPFDHSAVLAGNGTIGLEILEDLPDVDAVVIPYGGGGLCCGVGSAIRALRPGVRLFAAEVETGAPLAASWAAGRPVETAYTPSFVDGIGAPRVFPQMFAAARRLLEGSLVVSVSEVASAIRLLIERNHIVAEGAGAAPVAAALAGGAGTGKVACIVSGANIDPAKLVPILQGDVP
jgi:threonine dehydratase